MAAMVVVELGAVAVVMVVLVTMPWLVCMDGPMYAM